MSTPKQKGRYKSIIDSNLLRRGRSRGLSQYSDSTSTPKQNEHISRVTFSPREIVIPNLLPIPEEQIEIAPNLEETSPIPLNLQLNVNKPTTSKQAQQFANSDTSGLHFRTAFDTNLLDSNSSNESTSLTKTPPFQSTFARRLSFGKIPENETDHEDSFHLSFLFNESFEETMAVFKVSEIVNIIPSYDGKEEQLKLYVKSAKLYYENVAAGEKPIVLNILLSKLSGKAVEAIGNVDEIDTLDILITRLNEKIPEALSYTLAHTQLQKIVQMQNESINDYAIRFEAGLEKLKRAASQTNGALEITESIGKTLFIQNMNNKNLKIVAASSNASTAKEIIKYVKEKDLILSEKPSHEEASGVCGFCLKTNHTEKECSKRKYAQKLLKLIPDDSKNSRQGGGNNDNGNRNNFNKPYKSFNRQFNGDRQFNNNRSYNNGDGDRPNNNNNRSQNNRSHGGNFRNQDIGNHSNHQNGYSGSGNNSNSNYQNGGNRNFSNNRNTEGGNRNNTATNNNQRITLNSQNDANIPEDDLQVPLRELQAHAQFHTQNSGN